MNKLTRAFSGVVVVLASVLAPIVTPLAILFVMWMIVHKINKGY